MDNENATFGIDSRHLMRQNKRGAAFPKRQALRTLRVLCGAGLIGTLLLGTRFK